MIQLTFIPGNRVVEAEAGDTVLDAALQGGVALPHECGGNCACTTCHVIVIAGSEHLSRMEEVERDRLSTADALTPTSRLGCQAILLHGEVIVRIPESDLI
jgi:2Fe-2S ferredoxin